MRKLMIWSWILAAGLLAGCGGGGGGTAPVPTSAAPLETGQVVIGITDAEGDFSSYVVAVTSVQLERADGTRVEALPLTTPVDFAELTEVTELVSIATVPAGRYRSVTLGLDFTDAEVIVQDADGALHEATVQDPDGAPLGALNVTLNLAAADEIVIRRGIPAAVSLDFDLDASNSIDFSPSPPVVTVQPFLLATASLEPERTHRVRGLLASVDEADASFTLNVRPFRLRQGRFGELTLHINDDTVYEINGAGFTGAAGLDALAALGSDVPVVAFGAAQDATLVARTVLAGTSVPWTNQDAAQGAVVARSGDALTLSGVTVEYRDGLVLHRGEVTVLVDDDTRVTALGLPNDTLDKNSISVGQRVLALGTLADDLTLDAGAGHVRMEVSQLTADVLDPDDLTVSLYALNGRRPAAYDFTGTGADPSGDADPEQYQIDTSSLPLDSLETGDLVRVRGHVTPFGAAPPDFTALSVIEVSLNGIATFGAHWPVASAEPTFGYDPARIALDLSDASALLKLWGVPLDAVNPITELTLVPPESGLGVYAIRTQGVDEISVYRSFTDLADAVNERLLAGFFLRRVGAHGSYNAASGELVSHGATFLFVLSE